MPATLDLTPDELLTTTRAVRKRLDFDREVDMDLLRECLEIGLQAPTGSNAQNWHFVVVTDEAKKRAIADIYQDVWAWYREQPFSVHGRYAAAPEDEKRIAKAVLDSAEHLAQNFERVPVMVIPCMNGRPDQAPPEMLNFSFCGGLGGLLPAVWSFMLACRSRGLGTAWTSLHLRREQEVAEVLGIPYDKVTQAALIPVGHTIGDKFKPTTRHPLDDVLHVDAW